jgi:hypothetical protein
MKLRTVLLVSGLLTALPAVAKKPVMIDKPYKLEYKKGCTVMVYQTENQARKEGDFEEICIIEGTSSPSFVHTTETAIKQHAKDACDCGANKVFVASRSKMGVGVAKVSMIAFEWKNHHPSGAIENSVGIDANISSDAAVTGLPSVDKASRKYCTILRTIRKGSGGSGEGSEYLRRATDAAVIEAKNIGANAYYTTAINTTHSSASVEIEALRCNLR